MLKQKATDKQHVRIRLLTIHTGPQQTPDDSHNTNGKGKILHVTGSVLQRYDWNKGHCLEPFSVVFEKPHLHRLTNLITRQAYL
jgi:hypothetical protein